MRIFRSSLATLRPEDTFWQEGSGLLAPARPVPFAGPDPLRSRNIPVTDARLFSSGLRAVVVLCFGAMLAACNGLGGRQAPPPVVTPPPVVQVQPPPRVE